MQSSPLDRCSTCFPKEKKACILKQNVWQEIQEKGCTGSGSSLLNHLDKSPLLEEGRGSQDPPLFPLQAVHSPSAEKVRQRTESSTPMSALSTSNHSGQALFQELRDITARRSSFLGPRTISCRWETDT